MRHDLLINYVQAASITRYSEPFPMDGGNAVSVQTVGLSGTLSSVNLQQSDDLSNWANVASIGIPGAGPAFQIDAALGVSARYCRLKIVTGGGAVCVNVHVNTSRV